jgi:ubiquinone/menaquinone biosynthesis C-methylase UbiE
MTHEHDAAAAVDAPNRAQWLAERRRAAEQAYDRVYAASYDADDPPMSGTHAAFVSRVVYSCPVGDRILDAACGTGKYFSLVLDAGRGVVGADQSAGMLRAAAAKYPDIELRKRGLQELDAHGEFAAAICVDAMENVPPEQWPQVLAGLREAVRPGGQVYLTVERTDTELLEQAYAEARAGGLPVVPGEDARRGGGYHFYPTLEQVRGWLNRAELTVITEAHSAGDHPSYSYQHFLCTR